ncbi:hypothetical protein [Tropicimonas sp. IMCC6043]|uniref:hypothetical protein n=1 Tax=Tropicimonas sp. IMCC6043 TaxID=2510645 RepID=UPI00101BBCF0|nr:hypothetical protein [Tropicimonas sp. IMCC6043]RYH08826.1 hypothetical protein EU800_15205 [Tropicimonas sp. IMCC6043]
MTNVTTLFPSTVPLEPAEFTFAGTRRVVEVLMPDEFGDWTLSVWDRDDYDSGELWPAMPAAKAHRLLQETLARISGGAA